MALILSGTNGLSDVDGTAATPAIRGTDANTGMFFPAADTIAFSEGGVEAARFDASGNLGLGITTPTARLTVNGAYRQGGAAATTFEWTVNPGAQDFYKLRAVGGVDNLIVANTAGDVGIGTSSPSQKLTVQGSANVAGRGNTFAFMTPDWRMYNSTSGNAFVWDNYTTEAMRIDSSGNLLVGTTSVISGVTAKLALYSTDLANTANTCAMKNGANSTGGAFIRFANYLDATIGSITQSTSTTVAYNTSSDYRLKNITGPITTSGAYIDSLNPVEGTWKGDGSTFVGLIAHEVQEASRTPVATGTKDGEQMQGMDYSSAEIIANMLAELKSLRARVAQLEAK